MNAAPLTVPTTTPAGRRLSWLLDALAGRAPLEPVSATEQLSASFQASVPPVQLVAALLDIAADLGEIVVERLDEVSAYEMAARVVSHDLRLWVVRVVVEDVTPFGMTSASVSPARVPTDVGCSVPVPWPAVRAGGADSGGEPVVHTTLGDVLAARVDVLLSEARERLRTPALLASVTVGGESVLSWAGGFAEVATRRRPGRRNAVRASGLSRTVTALTVLSLAAEGLVGLDDPVGRHLRRVGLASLSGNDAVRVRDLLAHTSGLLPQPATVTGVRTGSRVPSLTELYAPTLVADLPRGQRVVAADENTVLAGLLVEDVTGQVFSEAAAARVLDPLDMTHSSFRLDSRVARVPVCGYDVDFDEIAVTAGSEVVLDAAYGLVSTLDDLALLGAALAEPARLGAVCGDLGEWLALDAAPTGLPGVGSGLGVFTATTADGRPALWQSGGWPGAMTALWAASGISVVLVGNSFSGPRLDALGGVGAELLALLVDALDPSVAAH
jgi:CubicO group peptidase (beta-lactamase class C family)